MRKEQKSRKTHLVLSDTKRVESRSDRRNPYGHGRVSVEEGRAHLFQGLFQGHGPWSKPSVFFSGFRTTPLPGENPKRWKRSRAGQWCGKAGQLIREGKAAGECGALRAGPRRRLSEWSCLDPLDGLQSWPHGLGWIHGIDSFPFAPSILIKVEVGKKKKSN